MSKQTKVSYRIIMECSEEGIERSLPYLLEIKEEAEALARILDDALYPKYTHRVEPSISHHMNTGKDRTYAYHGRQ